MTLASRGALRAVACQGVSPGVAERLREILERPDGLGAADPAAVLALVLDARAARGLRDSDPADADRRRFTALDALDAAIGEALGALYRERDAGLRDDLERVRVSVRERAKVRARRRERKRPPLRNRAETLAALQALGAKSREARYVFEHVAPAAVSYL